MLVKIIIIIILFTKISFAQENTSYPADADKALSPEQLNELCTKNNDKFAKQKLNYEELEQYAGETAIRIFENKDHPNNNIISRSEWTGSLMFSQKTIEKIRNIVD